MEFLTDNKLTAPVADSVDTDFQATNILKRRLWEKYKSAALTKGDTVTIDFTAEDWEGFSDDLKEEAEAGLTNRYKLNAETGATAEDSIGTDDVTLTAGVWEDTLPTNSRWMAGATGTVPTIIDNVQTVATVCFDEWWNDKVAASYQFREGNETLDSGYGQHD